MCSAVKTYKKFPYERSPIQTFFGKDVVKNRVHHLHGFSMFVFCTPTRDKSWDLFNGTYRRIQKSGFTII